MAGIALVQVFHDLVATLNQRLHMDPWSPVDCSWVVAQRCEGLQDN